MKKKIILIVENAKFIKLTNIILNVKIAKVNFVLNAQKQIIIYLIIHVLYVENNFYKEKENLLIVEKKKIILIVENARLVKLINIILNVKIAKVNFVLNVQWDIINIYVILKDIIDYKIIYFYFN